MRDLEKIRDESLRYRVREAIERVEAAETLRELPDVTRLSGASGFYRIRVGDYRIGIAVEGDELELSGAYTAGISTGTFLNRLA